MTPNLNANPLAALIANATKTSAGTDTPLNPGVVSAGQNGEKADLESKFSNILHIHKRLSSSILDGAGEGEPSPLAALTAAPHGLTQPVPGMAFQSGPLSGMPLQSGPVADLTAEAQIENELSYYNQLLDANSEEGPIDPALLAEQLPIPVPGIGPSGGGPGAGAGSPRGGNSLPPSVQNMLTGQQPGLDADGSELTQSALLAKAAPATPAAIQHPANHPLADGLAQPLPAPEFMEQMVKFQKPTPGISAGGTSPGLMQGMQGLADLAASASDTDGTGAELIRGNPLVTATDRPVAPQPAPAVMSLPRLAGAPGWDQGLGQRILWMVDNGLNRAELRLDPPHLGSINVRISVQDDQAQLMFQAAHPGARDALESALPRLREMFAQQGLELGNADVSDQNDNSARDSGGQEPELMTNSSARGSGSEAAGEAGNEVSENDSTLDKLQGRDIGNSLIDEFV